MKSTRNYRDALSFWMGMRRDMIAVRELETHYEPTFFGWIAFEHSHLCARRQRGWSRFPFNGFSGIKTHVPGLHVFGRQLCVIEENGEENDYYGAKNSFHGLIIVPDFVQTSVQKNSRYCFAVST